MKTYILVLFILFASPTIAGDVFLIGFSFLDSDKSMVAEEVNDAFPQGTVQLMLLPPNKDQPNLVSVEYVVQVGSKVYNGAGVGYNQMDAVDQALREAKKHIAAGK